MLDSDPRSSRKPSLPLRLLGIAVSLAALIAGSSRTRRLPPGQTLTVTLNTLFFVALGAADEWLLAPVLDRRPLARAAALAGETLALGWFFSPGGAKPASKMLFYVHIGPFFLAVFSGALGVALLRGWRSHAA